MEIVLEKPSDTTEGFSPPKRQKEVTQKFKTNTEKISRKVKIHKQTELVKIWIVMKSFHLKSYLRIQVQRIASRTEYLLC